MHDLQPILAPFSLLRMATLPYKALDAMRLPEVENLVDQLLRLEQSLAGYREQLDAALFSLVSALAEEAVELRRAVLKLKRNIHNGRKANVEAPLFSQIAALLSTDDRQCLEQWNASHIDYEALLVTAATLIGEQRQSHLRPALRAPLQQPLFKQALAFASAGVATQAIREKRLPTKAKPDNFERSLFGYLIRAAAKTSPFSSFMSMTAVALDFTPSQDPAASLQANDLKHVCRTRLNRGIPARLFRQAALLAARQNEMPLRVNDSLKQIGAQRFSALCERDVVLLGRPWTETRAGIFRLHDQVSEVFVNHTGEASWQQWQQRLCQSTGAGVAQVDNLLDKFIRKGLLLTRPFTDTFDPQPELTLMQRWSVSKLPELIAATERVAQMVALSEQIAADDSAQRANEIDTIRELEGQALKLLGMPRYDRFHNTVLEDCWGSGVEGKIAADGLSEIRQLHDFLATQVIFIPEYIRLRRHFTERFGIGGECTEVTEFISEIGNKLVEISEYGASAKKEAREFAPKGSQLGVTAQIQLIRSGHDNSPPQIVVNRVFDRPGWLASRFCFGEQPEQQFLRHSLGQWLETLCGDAEPVDLLINGHSNDLQTHPRLTKRALCWPSAPLPDSGQQTLDAASLTLRHDPGSDRLQLFDGEGKAISLVYLGSTFPTAAWGIPYVLSILTQPFTLDRPDFKPPVMSQTEDVIYNPRIEHGKVILSRAFWWVRSDHLLKNWFAGKDIHQLLDIRRDCQARGLPTTFYAKPFNAPDSGGISHQVLHGDRKPLWVSCNNLFSLAMLERLAQKNSWLSITEALPGPEQLWLDIDGNKHVSELQIEMRVLAMD